MTANKSSLSGISRVPPSRCSGTAHKGLLLPSQSRTSPRKTSCVRAVAAAAAPSGQRRTALPYPKRRARKMARLTIPKAATVRAA